MPDPNADNTPNLRLTDFLDLSTLQEIQDGFAAVADVRAIITDADGSVLTQPTPASGFLRRQRALAAEGERTASREGTEYVAPIIVNDQRLGSIRMSASNGSPAGVSLGVDESKLAALAEKFGLEPKQVRQLVNQWVKSKGSATKPAAIQFLFLLANAIARLCYQEFQLRQRVSELTALHNVASLLADARDLNRVLRRTVEVVAQVMGAKAASIRLIDRERDELVIKATHNLSPEYLAKGPIRLSKAEIDHEALGPAGYAYVRNMTQDPRVQYPQQSAREGVVSMLSAGMRYQGNPIGVLRVYTSEEHAFSPLEVNLLKAVAAQAAAAIENARLLQETLEAEALERQVRMAAEVQQRMIPQTPPRVPGLDLATVYVPCYTLGGDFYDLIPLPDDNLGLCVADVSGKGVPASLTMASVRAFLRAQVDNVYYLYEVMRRINLMLHRDTKPGEFVTVFYGVLDARNLRFTYCNAGHSPGLLLRGGQVTELGSDNMVLGVSPEEQYSQSVVQLHRGDTLLLYTDGLADGMNRAHETFGRQRILESFRQGGATAEEVAQRLLWDLRKFVGMAPPTDDVTMLVVRVA